MLIPATWMMALKGSLPALVSTAPPKGVGPFLPISGLYGSHQQHASEAEGKTDGQTLEL